MKKHLIIVSIISFTIGLLGFFEQADSVETLPLSKIAPLSAELEAKTEVGTLNWQEYKLVIEKYNLKLAEIKKYCSLDKRCENGKVNFGEIKSKWVAVAKINKWIRESNQNYGK